MSRETKFYKTDKSPYYILSNLFSSVYDGTTTQYEWFWKLMNRSILMVPYPTYFDDIFRLILSKWKPEHQGALYVLKALTALNINDNLFNINDLCNQAQCLRATSTLDAWRVVDEISKHIISTESVITIPLLQTTMNYLHSIIELLVNKLPTVHIPAPDVPINIFTERDKYAFIQQQLKRTRENYSDVENTDAGMRFVAALSIYQVVLRFNRKLQHVQFDKNVQMWVRMLPSYDERNLFMFINTQVIDDMIDNYSIDSLQVSI